MPALNAAESPAGPHHVRPKSVCSGLDCRIADLPSVHGLRPTPLALVRLPITCLLKHMPVQAAPVRAARGSGMPLLARGKRGAPIYTVVDFEKERRLVSEEAVKAIQTALQRAGIEFTDQNGAGEGLLLRKRQKSCALPQASVASQCL
jgi:hypothetical protein